MSWGPIDPDWGEGWENFDIDPFDDGERGHIATVTRLPRTRPGRRGQDLNRSITAPRPTAPRSRAPRRPEPSAPAFVPDTHRDEDVPPTRRRLRVVDGGGGGGRPPRWFGSGPAGADRRSLLIKAAFGVLLLAVVGKLVDVQVLDRDTYTEVGESQRLRTVTLDASRGRILDREGHDLALSVLRPSVFADPSQITDPAAVATQLAPVLGTDVVELTEKLSRESQFVWLNRRVDDDLATRVVELDLDGIHLHEEPTRFNPSGTLAQSIIGTVAPDQVGSTGLEFLFDDVLTGTPGELRYERARDGGTIAAGAQSRVPATPGDDLVLTIDRSLQYEAERALAAQVDAMGADGGIVIVQRPATGEILAMANITRTTDGEIITAGANRAVIDAFEPGSVNKVITIAAALEEGIVEPESTRTVPWQYQVSDHRFSDDHFHPTAPMTVIDILAQSSNVGTIMLGQELGKERLDEYLRKFGFGERTALNFPNESPGILLDPANYTGTSIGTIPIGQGIAVTALQMLQAYNVIANDGVYVEPRLVEATISADGSRDVRRRGEGRRVVSAETAAQVRAMLVEAVENGTDTNAQVDGYTVAGKTGTARKPQESGGYADAAGNYQYVAGFTGMVPAEDPELTMIVAIDEPSASIYGGTAAAPLFAELSNFALSRFQIPPTPVREN